MKNTRWTILAALILAATSVAHAQSPSFNGGPPPGFVMPSGVNIPAGAFPGAPGAGGAAGATADSGAVSNAQTAQTTQTTTTTTSSAGIGPDGFAVEGDAGMETTELANTGGEPVLMSLLGLSMALGALAIRKRVSA